MRSLIALGLLSAGLPLLHAIDEDARSLLAGGALRAGEVEVIGVLGASFAALPSPGGSTDEQVVASGFIGQIGNQVPQLRTPDNLRVPGTVQLDATDGDGDRLIFVITQDPEHGSLSGSGPEFTYTPNAPDFRGNDSFQVHVHDGADRSATVLVELVVGGPRRLQMRVLPQPNDLVGVEVHPGDLLQPLDDDQWAVIQGLESGTTYELRLVIGVSN